jgi:glyoxylase I family protein
MFIFLAGQSAIAIRGPESGTPAGDQFNPFRVGLDHVALGCEDPEDLKMIEQSLHKAGIENTGIKLDETLNKKYIAFKDPDRISWEYYMV